MTTVLAAVDGTQAARPVLQTATCLANLLEAGTLAIHVGHDPGLAQEIAEELGASMIVVPTAPMSGGP